MKLTVLGSSAAYAGPGHACSGYLIESGPDRSSATGPDRLVVDLGNGALANLLRHAKPEELAAIVITHLHPDHYLDLYPLRYYLKYTAHVAPPGLRVLAPAGAEELLTRLMVTPEGETASLEVLDFGELTQGEHPIGELLVTARHVQHGPPTFALRVEGEATAVFSSDTGDMPALVELARGADALVCESTYLDPDLPLGQHLNARKAGEVAREAGVGRLVLTHLWPTYDRAEAVRQAAAVFDGPVETAEENQTIPIAAAGA